MLALELLEHCYKLDDDYTQQLLTYEIKTFSEQTNLGLAVTANHRQFIAHTACQVLLNDLWIGGLRMRKNTSLKASSSPGHLEHPWVGGGEVGGVCCLTSVHSFIVLPCLAWIMLL